ncbi:MAG: J domain-containing protein [Clostridiales bacterium]|nr:J domain-containing protein [Clostridiales bacterium]
MKDPYALLGLTRDADHELIRTKYKELHAKYSEQRFKPGAEGNRGARKLQELEEAWSIISSEIDVAGKTANEPDYGKIDELIRAGKYNEAQDMLDSVTDRKGEWHYMQSIVFYKRDWLTESKAQLEMAIQDDPTNPKYRSSLEKLNMAMNNPRQGGYNAGQTYGQNGQAYGQNGPTYEQPPQQQPQQSGENLGNCLSSCCCAYCLTDCLCSALRCL